MTIEILRTEALKLSPEERARLIESLWESLAPSDQKEMDATWAREAEERVDAYDQGKIRATPARKVFEEIRQLKTS